MYAHTLCHIPTLCDPMDCSPLGSFVHGNFPGKNPRLPLPTPGDLPDPSIKLASLNEPPALATKFFTPVAPGSQS